MSKKFKRKEKELTKEEATELARKENEPFWINSKPLATAVEMDGKAHIYPLYDEYAETSWLLSFIDITTMSGSDALSYLDSWRERFLVHNVRILLIIRPNYEYLKDREFIQSYLERRKLNYACIIDHNGLFEKAYDVTKHPEIILYADQKILARTHEIDEFSKIELEIHKLLRKEEPGLPLYRPYTPKTAVAKDIYGIEVGSHGETEFIDVEYDDFDSAGFDKLQGKERPTLIRMGKWDQEPDAIVTSDQKAGLKVIAPRKNLSFLASTRHKNRDAARIYIELDGRPVLDNFVTPSILSDDEGNSYIEVSVADIYHGVKALNGDYVKVTLRFQHAFRSTIAIHKILFFD